MSAMFETEMETGARCADFHALKFVAEGYAYCFVEHGFEIGHHSWHAWSLTPHDQWKPASLLDKDCNLTDAWVRDGLDSREAVVLAIRYDMERRRVTLTEAQQRARLMPI